MMTRPSAAFLASGVLLLIASCSSADYDEKMSYLREVAQRGVEAHRLIESQQATVDKPRCEAAYSGLVDDIPTDVAGGNPSAEWSEQVKQFYVDSCVSGLPKATPDETQAPSPTSSSRSATPTAPAP